MNSPGCSPPDVYTAAEVIRAAGLDSPSLDKLEALIAVGEIRTVDGSRFLSHREALRAAALVRAEIAARHIPAAPGSSPASHRGWRSARVARRDERAYREYVSEEQRSHAGCSASRMQPDLDHGLPDAASGRFASALTLAGRPVEGVLFGAAAAGVPRRPALSLVVSSVLHSAVLTSLVALTTLGVGASVAAVEPEPPQKINLVYLNIPGPGGGGGGGGLRQKAPPPKAERQGTRRVSSPVPVRTPPPVVTPVEKPAEPPPLKAEPLPPVIAPVVHAPADARDRIGVLTEGTNAPESRGLGTGGGVGSGRGTGVGEGDGAGIGPGTGGGTGGGPYRPGSGIEPPRLLREIKPDYTDEARRRNLEGDVELEIVIRRDGTVGDVRVMRGLGAGLDQRAVDAVRQWKFSPARRLGSPVDVIVEVAVEFRLR